MCRYEVGGGGGGDRTAPKAQRTRLLVVERPADSRHLPVIPAPVAIVRVRIIGSVLLTLGLPVYRALADVCLSQLTS